MNFKDLLALSPEDLRQRINAKLEELDTYYGMHDEQHRDNAHRSFIEVLVCIEGQIEDMEEEAADLVNKVRSRTGRTPT